MFTFPGFLAWRSRSVNDTLLILIMAKRHGNPATSRVPAGRQGWRVIKSSARLPQKWTDQSSNGSSSPQIFLKQFEGRRSISVGIIEVIAGEWLHQESRRQMGRPSANGAATRSSKM